MTSSITWSTTSSPPVLVASTNSIAAAILTESSLSYLGFGISIPNASWGGMLQGAQTYILTNPMLAFYPGCRASSLRFYALMYWAIPCGAALDPKSRR